MTPRNTSHNTGLAKVAVQFSEDTFVVKIVTFLPSPKPLQARVRQHQRHKIIQRQDEN